MVCLSLQVYIFTKFRVFFQILSIQLHRGDDLTMLLIIVLQIFYAFGAMFIACELGQRVNLAFNECSEMIHRFDWYLLPVWYPTTATADNKFCPATHRHQMLRKCRMWSWNNWICECVIKSIVLMQNVPSLLWNLYLKLKYYSQVIRSAFSYFTILRNFFNWINK